MEYATSVICNGDRVSMVGRISQAHHFGLVLSRLSESAKLGEACDQKEPVEDRQRCGASEGFVGPFSRQRREVLGGKFNYPPVLGPMVMTMLKVGRRNEAKFQIPQTLCNVQRTGAGEEGLIRDATQKMCVCHKGINLASATIVVQLLSEDLGFPQALQSSLGLPELYKNRPQFEANREAQLKREFCLGQSLERYKRVFKPCPGVLERPTRN